MFFGFGHVTVLAGFVHGAACLFDHAFDEIVGVDHRALTALHFAVGEFDHAVGEVHEALSPLETETIEQEREHLEVVVLLVADDIDHFVDGIVAETEFGGTDVLGHVDRSSVRTEEELLIESVLREIGPNGAVFAAIEEAFGESFLYLFLAFEVGFRLVVDLVERNAECLVGFVETGIDPLVHFTPERAHFFVALLPLAEHFTRFDHERRFVLGASFGFFGRYAFGFETGFEFGHFGAVVLIERHIVVADKVVAFLTGGLGRVAVAVFLPGKHGFADVDTAVIDDIRLHDTAAVGFCNLGHRPSEQVVANVTEVEGFVGVGRGVFDHGEGALFTGCGEAVTLIGVDVLEELDPLFGRDGEVEEALDDVERRYEVGVFDQPQCEVFSGVFGLSLGNAQEGEGDHGEVSLEVGARFLNLHLFGGDVGAVAGFDGLDDGVGEQLFDVHCMLDSELCYAKRGAD